MHVLLYYCIKGRHLLSFSNKIIDYCMDGQNNKYDNEDIVDCLDVFNLIEVCEKRISRHKLFLCQTTTSASIPEMKVSAYYTLILQNNTLKVSMIVCQH
jgi:hypothetical protein